MAKEQEIDIIDGEESENSPEEQIQREDKIRQVLDARDFITPLDDVGDKSLDSDNLPDSAESKGPAEQEIELPLDGNDFPMDNDQINTAEASVFEDDDTMADEETEPSDPTDAMPSENENPVEKDVDPDGTENAADDLSTTDDSGIKSAEDQTGVDEEEEQGLEALPDTDLPGRNPKPKIKNTQRGKSGENAENDFLPLDEDEVDLKPSEIKNLKSKVSSSPKPSKNKPEKTADQENKTEIPPVKSKQKETAKKPAVESVAPGTVNRPSMINKMIGFTLAVVVVAGFIFYNNPALVGLKKASEPTPAPMPEAVQPAQPAAESIDKTPPPPSPLEKLATRLEEAADIRKQLLQKREEINRLDLYYRNGIAELEEIILREAQKEGIKSLEQALENKRIELNLRTIQRRRSYIHELEKPALWIDHGSEELLYLIRKAQLDLELIDIAGGIDLNKHNRHISAAINQYRLGNDKLAVHLQDDQLTPLETIWQQASNKKNRHRNTSAQISLNTKDGQIATEICSGNLDRIAELTSISTDTARCLSRMKGSDLFLNAVTQLLPDAARELFQWQGNWICLNGLKALSPAVAKYLFQWKGNWISLNGLTKFQPELAVYLLKWEGQQLELMGLKYNNTQAEQKTLKYLALWETTGGKLFVSDEIKKEMGRIMLSQLQ
jgi:hypothetical protein